MRKIGVLALCALAVFSPLPTLAQGKPPPKPTRTRLPLEVRRAAIGPAASGELRLVPNAR